MKTFKQKVHQHLKEIIKDKISRLQKLLDDLHETGANETKSTAGDKHETALAMIQIEQSNVRKQLSEMNISYNMVLKIDPLSVIKNIHHGSLISTDNGYFFLSAALGKIIIDGTEVYTLSVQSPFGIHLAGKSKGDVVKFNNRSYNILECY